MYNFFIILLNRRVYSPNATDLVHACTSDIYFSMKYYTEPSVNYNTKLLSFIDQYCSLATYSNVTSGILPQVIIYPSSKNNTTDVIKFHNTTYSEYEIFGPEIHTICMINVKDIDKWGLTRLTTLYQMICHHQSSSGKDYCVSIHNSNALYNIEVTLKMMYTAFCIPNHNIKTLGTNISETTALLQHQNRVLEEQNIFLKKENSGLSLKLEEVTRDRDFFKNKVFNLEFDIKLLKNRIDLLTTTLTITQNHEKELHVQLNDTTLKLQKANHSVQVTLGVLERLKNYVSGLSDDEATFNHFNSEKENYTNYLKGYGEEKESTDKSLRNIDQNIKTYEQEIESLQGQLQNKTIELDNTYDLLNITLSYIDHIHNIVTPLTTPSPGILKHGVSKRNINKQYNEALDDYISQQLMDDSYETRVADSERKVEEIFTVFASIENENNILKSLIYQKGGKGIDDLQSYDLTENNKIINKEYSNYLLSYFNQFNYSNKSLSLLSDHYIGNGNSTNKLIDSTQVNPYPVAVGSIAFSAVVLYLINKYCFSITKWPIMVYKYIAKSWQISETKMEDSFEDSFYEDCNIPVVNITEPLYLPPNPNNPSCINVMNAENICEEMHNDVNMLGQARLQL